MAINWINNGKIEMISEVSTIRGKEEYFTIKMETYKVSAKYLKILIKIRSEDMLWPLCDNIL